MTPETGSVAGIVVAGGLVGDTSVLSSTVVVVVSPGTVVAVGSNEHAPRSMVTMSRPASRVVMSATVVGRSLYESRIACSYALMYEREAFAHEKSLDIPRC